jgi:hypothetical protein
MAVYVIHYSDNIVVLVVHITGSRAYLVCAALLPLVLSS